MSVIEQLVDQIEARFADAEREMGDPQVITDRDRYAAAGRAYRQLEPAAKLAEEWRRAIDDEAGARELLEESGDDAEVRDLLANARGDIDRLEEESASRWSSAGPQRRQGRHRRGPRGPLAGAEADLWAGDMFRLLTRYADRRGFKTEVLESTDGHHTFAIKGDGAYCRLKWEGGTHRVQRVPETESQGRIHTSTATVAVLPEAEEVDVQIDPNDLKIDVYRSSGPGGQSVNTTDSAVRITHKPTGIVVSMQDEKSPAAEPGEGACACCAPGCYEQSRTSARQEASAAAAAQVGTGDRCEKIRTYNFRENRVTDHRIGLTLHNLDGRPGRRARRVHRRAQADERRRALQAQAKADAVR